MLRYLIQRLLQGVLVVALVTCVVFIISRLSGSPVDQMLPENATEDQRRALEGELGLDQPMVVQFGTFLLRILQGDFGESHRFRSPALELVLERLGDTLVLAASALVIGVIVGTLIGLISALRQGRALDNTLGLVLTAGQSIPSFWFGIILILVFGVTLKALPFTGNSGFQSLILPAITLSIVPIVAIARIARSSIIETLGTDFIVTARAKGLRPVDIIARHVIRNSAMSILTITGLMFTEAVSGAVVTETLFAWPGIGALAVEAISVRDYAVVQTITIIVAVLVVIISIVIDLLYRLVDPRVRLESGEA